MKKFVIDTVFVICILPLGISWRIRNSLLLYFQVVERPSLCPLLWKSLLSFLAGLESHLVPIEDLLVFLRHWSVENRSLLFH